MTVRTAPPQRDADPSVRMKEADVRVGWRSAKTDPRGLFRQATQLEPARVIRVADARGGPQRPTGQVSRPVEYGGRRPAVGRNPGQPLIPINPSNSWYLHVTQAGRPGK